MKREDVEKLLGGYATGTLSDAERKALFEAAAGDQELFDALAGEEVLRELLEDPHARRRLLAALEPRPSWFRRPMAWALAGAVAATATVAVVMVRLSQPPAAKIEVAMSKTPPPAAAQAPEPVAPPPAVERFRPAKPPAQTRREEPPPAPPPSSLPTEAAAVAREAKSAFGETTRADSRTAGNIAAGPALMSPPPHAAIHWTILRRDETGSFLPLETGGQLAPDDQVAIEVEPPEAGWLSVAGAGATAPAVEVEKGRRYRLGPYSFPEQRGDRKLLLTLSRTAPPALAARAKMPLGAGLADARKNAAAPVTVEIALPYRATP